MKQQNMHGFKVKNCVTAVGAYYIYELYGQIWTSQLKRSIQTAQFLDGLVEQWRSLNELDVVGQIHIIVAVKQ